MGRKIKVLVVGMGDNERGAKLVVIMRDFTLYLRSFFAANLIFGDLELAVLDFDEMVEDFQDAGDGVSFIALIDDKLTQIALNFVEGFLFKLFFLDGVFEVAVDEVGAVAWGELLVPLADDLAGVKCDSAAIFCHFLILNLWEVYLIFDFAKRVQKPVTKVDNR